MCKARFLLDGLMQGKYDLREQTADGTKTGETGLKYFFFFVFSWQSFFSHDYFKRSDECPTLAGSQWSSDPPVDHSIPAAMSA